jgi:hypothetical protein
VPLQTFSEADVATIFDERHSGVGGATDDGCGGGGSGGVSGGSLVEQVLILLYVLTYNRCAKNRVQRLLQFPEPLAPSTPPPYSVGHPLPTQT